MQQNPIWDLAIIGSGFAGLAAARRARAKGRGFALLARDFGATLHFSGAFDCVDARWVDSSLSGHDFSWTDFLTRFCLAHPEHLYSQILKNRDADIESFLESLRDFVKFYQLPVVGDAEHPVWALGASGFFKPVAFAWATQAFTPAEIASASSVACVGFAGVLDYPTDLIAKNLSRVFAKVQSVTFAGIPVLPTAPYVSVLKGLENPENAETFLQFLQTTLQSCDVVILPPVLSDRLLDKVARRFPGRVKEMLGVLPSLPGQRFKKHILDFFKKNEFPHFTTDVQALQLEDNKIVAAHGTSAQGESKTQAQNWILATGKFVGGGLVHKNEQFYENLLHLPLVANGAPVSAKTHITQLMVADAKADQAFLTLGVPYGLTQKPQNLQICGHLLAGFDFSRQHCGFGVSVASAYSLDI